MIFSRREAATLLIGDGSMLVLSLWVALTLRNLEVPALRYFEANVTPFIPMFGISIAIFYIAGLYEKQTRPIRRIMGARIMGAQAATVALAAILFFILPLTIAPKTILFMYLIVSIVFMSAWRFWWIRRASVHSTREPAVIIGTGTAVDELVEELQANERLLIRSQRVLDPNEVSESELVALVADACNTGARLLVCDVSHPRVRAVLPALYELVKRPIVLTTFSALYEELFDRVPLDHIDADLLLESTSRPRQVYDTSKRLFDILLALTLALIALPLVFVAAVLLWSENRRVFITSGRVGQDGRVFPNYKLRTMLFDDRGDPELRKHNRVTALGKLLRKSRIDELPQLWNIVRGDLSFIGPRPELPTLVAVYEAEIPFYAIRHGIAPGLSGWAQIHDYDAPRGGADIERTRRKLSLDLYYVRHRSFGLDLAIATKTLRALATLTGS
jgi:lipopolysaccharide/colanic/teichoic acid biosynthesis glycosyltransferase